MYLQTLNLELLQDPIFLRLSPKRTLARLNGASARAPIWASVKCAASDTERQISLLAKTGSDVKVRNMEMVATDPTMRIVDRILPFED